MHNAPQDTICALATPEGTGAIAVIRLSGEKSIAIVNQVFPGKNLLEQASHTLHFGAIKNQGKLYDEVLVSLFKGPHSYTGENSVEISCHGSPYIIKEILQLLIANGAKAAGEGEFTLRAFLNGKLDLSQAEAVADLINSNSDAAHQVALNQMRGGFSDEIKKLREELIHFASLVELELDFGEEDVEFANRSDLKDLINKILTVLKQLIDSFALGNVIKEGIPTVIAGKPNAGKSTLLNTLLNEDKALVTDIEGTTRDTIEDEITLGGLKFRFIDTAGLRSTTDKVEALGVEKSYAKMKQAACILYLFDPAKNSPEEVKNQLDKIASAGAENTKILLVGNKVDQAEEIQKAAYETLGTLVWISAKEKLNIDQLQNALIALANQNRWNQNQTLVTNTRHWQELTEAQNALLKALEGLETGVTGDFIAMDIRASLYHLGLITGEITNDDLLDNIFGKFCIGK